MTSYVMKGHGISTENIFNYFLFWLMVRFENLSAGRRQLFVSNNFSHFPTGLTFFKAIIKQWFNIRLQFNFFLKHFAFRWCSIWISIITAYYSFTFKKENCFKSSVWFLFTSCRIFSSCFADKTFRRLYFFLIFFLTLSFFIASDRPFSNFQFVHNKGCHQRNYLF